MGIKVQLPEGQLRRVEAMAQQATKAATKATANVRNGLIGAAVVIGGVWAGTTFLKKRRGQ